MHATVLAPDDAQAALRAWLGATPALRRAVAFEGGFAALEAPDDVVLLRLPAGCPCCEAQVPLRVGLVRMLRAQRPEHLLVLVRRAEHADRVRALLADGSLGVRFEIATPSPAP